jgi:hypothetical protein
MLRDPTYPPPRRRRTWPRYVLGFLLLLALGAGWTWAWDYAAGMAQAALEGWRAREAKAGRVYNCGSQSVGGYPFRIEVSCANASAIFRSNQPPVEIKAGSVLVATQVYEPTQITSDIGGPVTVAKIGGEPIVVANWALGRSSVSGTPKAPQRVSLVFDQPVVNLVTDGRQQNLLRAQRIEVHGRIVEGSAASNPVIEVVLRLKQASAPGFSRATVQPVDAEITAVLHGLGDFSPKPWRDRFRELQERGGHIDITAAKIRQGATLAVGSGSLAIDRNGNLDGQVNVTVAGLEPFLVAIGAPQAVQKSHSLDKVAGMLDRLSPGLGDVAREQAGANLSTGLTLIGKPASLEGRQAVTLPLRFKDGTAFLGPIALGNTPALF